MINIEHFLFLLPSVVWTKNNGNTEGQHEKKVNFGKLPNKSILIELEWCLWNNFRVLFTGNKKKIDLYFYKQWMNELEMDFFLLHSEMLLRRANWKVLKSLILDLFPFCLCFVSVFVIYFLNPHVLHIDMIRGSISSIHVLVCVHVILWTASLKNIYLNCLSHKHAHFGFSIAFI